MPDEQERPPLHPFIENIFRVIDENIYPHCVSIMHAKGEQRYEHRSGVLVQVGNKRFLVTAAHHYTDYFSSEIDSFILQKEQGSHPVRIDAVTTILDEERDLAVFLLSDALVVFLDTQFQYLRINDFASNDRDKSGWFLLVGFPFARINPDEDGILLSESWKYASRRYRETENVQDYNPEIHLIVQYERDTHDGTRIVHPPSMSGCGVWHLEKESPQIVTARDLKLCAIQTAWSKNFEYAKTTWAEHVIDIIWTNFPELREIMRFHGCR